MKAISRDTLERSLAEKGFEKEESRDHRFWYFFYRGRKTAIRTKISRGTGYKDYPVSLLKRIRGQLSLDSLSQLDDLLRCPMNGEEYTELMMRKGVILQKES